MTKQSPKTIKETNQKSKKKDGFKDKDKEKEKAKTKPQGKTDALNNQVDQESIESSSSNNDLRKELGHVDLTP